MPRYYIVIFLPIVTICALWFTVIHPMIQSPGLRYYKLYKHEHATTIVVVNRAMSPIECFMHQVEMEGTMCRREGK